jgi:hypothetical protein
MIIILDILKGGKKLRFSSLASLPPDFFQGFKKREKELKKKKVFGRGGDVDGSWGVFFGGGGKGKPQVKNQRKDIF